MVNSKVGEGNGLPRTIFFNEINFNDYITSKSSPQLPS
jgi:hypothetical protein